MVSKIMREMTAPVEQILGGPKVEPLQGKTREGLHMRSQVPTLHGWKQMSSGAPRPLPRIRSHIAAGPEQHEGGSAYLGILNESHGRRRGWRLPSPLGSRTAGARPSVVAVRPLGAGAGSRTSRKPPLGPGGAAAEHERRFRALEARGSALHAGGRGGEYEACARGALRAGFEACLALERGLRRGGACDAQRGRVARRYARMAEEFAAREVRRLQEMGRGEAVAYFRAAVRVMTLRRLRVLMGGARARGVVAQVGAKIARAAETGGEAVALGREHLLALRRVVLEYQLVAAVADGLGDVGEECRVA